MPANTSSLSLSLTEQCQRVALLHSTIRWATGQKAVAVGELWWLCTTRSCHHQKERKTGRGRGEPKKWRSVQIELCNECAVERLWKRLLLLRCVARAGEMKASCVSSGFGCVTNTIGKSNKCRLWSLMNGTATKHRQILLMNTKEEANRAPLALHFALVVLALFTVCPVPPNSKHYITHWQTDLLAPSDGKSDKLAVVLPVLVTDLLITRWQ